MIDFHDDFYGGWIPQDEEDEVTHNDAAYTCECGRNSIGDSCGQCGMPLCPMCFESGGGFCSKHPDEDFEGY